MMGPNLAEEKYIGGLWGLEGGYAISRAKISLPLSK